jgi:hypothetical protein
MTRVLQLLAALYFAQAAFGFTYGLLWPWFHQWP